MGFRAAYGSIGLMGYGRLILLTWRLPSRETGAPVDLYDLAELGRNRTVLLLLSITTLQICGQFVVFTFMGPPLAKPTGAGPDAIGLVFAPTASSASSALQSPHASWTLGRLPDVGAVHGSDAGGRYRLGAERRHLRVNGRLGRDLGLGFASTNSMQQVRLVAAAPTLAPALVSSNTSVLYIDRRSAP